MTNKTTTLTTTEIEREIVAALTETDPEGHSMTKFLPIRRELERRPGITYAAPVTALLSLWERGEVEVVMVRGSAYVKLSDTFDRTPDHPAAIARGEHRRLMAV
ncbi:hypothetical protein FOV72_03770 [Gordonia rubripertincta]|uniref:hypothetical protein n=1 Tax=Gordonia rubripertincta TaxID=36822 RepID=UPI00117D5CED|nr:hypothetical protein [Gordonia rubripertincta]TSD98883.1 hypothetical protein FOV72_03770 [Gordonia rubripertincta]